jgi:hypothetical protein
VPSRKRYEDVITNRKCIHVKLLQDTHSNLRIELFKRKLSIQEVFEELAQRLTTGDPVIIDILDELIENKKNKKIKQLSEADANSIFDAIENSIDFSKRED